MAAVVAGEDSLAETGVVADTGAAVEATLIGMAEAVAVVTSIGMEVVAEASRTGMVVVVEVV